MRACVCVCLLPCPGERREETDLVEALDSDSALVPSFRVFNAHEYNCVRNNFLRAGFLRQHTGDEWCVGSWWWCVCVCMVFCDWWDARRLEATAPLSPATRRSKGMPHVPGPVVR